MPAAAAGPQLPVFPDLASAMAAAFDAEPLQPARAGQTQRKKRRPRSPSWSRTGSKRRLNADGHKLMPLASKASAPARTSAWGPNESLSALDDWFPPGAPEGRHHDDHRTERTSGWEVDESLRALYDWFPPGAPEVRIEQFVGRN